VNFTCKALMQLFSILYESFDDNFYFEIMRRGVMALLLCKHNTFLFIRSLMCVFQSSFKKDRG